MLPSVALKSSLSHITSYCKIHHRGMLSGHFWKNKRVNRFYCAQSQELRDQIVVFTTKSC